jgi:hypothetical protein
LLEKVGVVGSHLPLMPCSLRWYESAMGQKSENSYIPAKRWVECCLRRGDVLVVEQVPDGFNGEKNMLDCLRRP